MSSKVQEPEAILARLRRVQQQEQQDAFAVLRRLTNPTSVDTVTDGELVDAAFAFTARMDLSNPLVPLMSHLLERFMVLAGIQETPKGLKRDYFAERS